MDEILGYLGGLIERGFRLFGLWILKLLTDGRYRDTNSYLYFLPTFIGFVTLAVLSIAILCIFLFLLS
ncbi:hypothetical protein [Phytopseudomonas punonensis]|uniref:Uncharacterized protein n=1 Tax=Phytopseudomonas punonensis TaxID=1220495 RepID=A0A1M7G4U4_9GAMM|nr:hypothetical protein [Pseudomonas punonensis]SHM11394.1 hypothetical protein SAMN05216288_3072 [Pseudomonas punonensis]